MTSSSSPIEKRRRVFLTEIKRGGIGAVPFVEGGNCPRALTAIVSSGLARGLIVLENLAESRWLDVLELWRAWRQLHRISEGNVEGPISGRWVVDGTIRDAPWADRLQGVIEDDERACIIPTLCEER